MILAAIEAGGTKFVWGILKADSNDFVPPRILEKGTVPTTTPEETLAAVSKAIHDAGKRNGRPELLGIGCFGPVVLKAGDPDWGKISRTPKPGWSGVDVAGFFKDSLGLPIAFDTDVNAAAYGEYLWGAAKGIRDFVYLTVGTGIGGGVFSGGQLVHGLAHPELGHIKVPRIEGDSYEGGCPYHKDCLEGLASGPAIAARWGRRGEELPAEHEAWELEAAYLAKAAATYCFVLSPDLILIGGGIGLRPGLVEHINVLLGNELARYVPALASPERLAGYVQRPTLGANAGLIGAAGLAMRIRTE